jgi:HD-GYP domain-containing protein (c-di-GMP phosphodiesterase class II)
LSAKHSVLAFSALCRGAFARSRSPERTLSEPHAVIVPTTLADAGPSGVPLLEPLGTAVGLQVGAHEAMAHLVTRLAAAALESLLHAIDANDPETGAHVRRVAITAVVLARAADWDAVRQHRVERVALFHDIGKINGALFDVMRGTVGLTSAERTLIATHADRGAEVLAPLASFYPELPTAVRAHHEWWDGRGYPRGLRGTAIPFEARIVSIADVFDALTHRRRYKIALPVGRADELIAAGRGTQFDPDLTDLFLSPPVQEEIRDAQAAHASKLGVHPRGGARSDPRRQAGPRGDTPEIAFRWRATKGD